MKKQASTTKRPIVVIGAVRSGTTVFRRFLSSHEKITDFGEIFNSSNVNNFFFFLAAEIMKNRKAILPENTRDNFDAFFDVLRKKVDSPLVDIKYEHLNLFRDAWSGLFSTPTILDYLNAGKLPVIHVIRRRIFDSLVSDELAKSTKVYHKSAADSPNHEPGEKIHISLKQMQSRIAHRRKTVDYVRKTLGCPVLEVYYEDFFQVDADGSQSFSAELQNRISGFLEIEPKFNSKPELEKVIDKPFDDILKNYAELCVLKDEEI